MNYIDLIISIPLVWGAYKGFRKGLIVEIASLIALIAGVYGAIEFSIFISDFLSQYVEWSPRIMHIVSFCLTFLGIVVLVNLIAKGIQKVAKLAALGTLDRVLGVVFGTLKYLVIVAILFYLVDTFNSRYKFIDKKTTDESLFYTPVISIVPGIYPSVERYIETED